MIQLRLILCISLFLNTAHSVAEEQKFNAQHLEFFEAKIRPVLVEHCFDCHSTDAKKLKAGLYVDSREGLLKGGDSGTAAIPGIPDASILIDAIKYTSYEMPPNEKLNDATIRDLVKWVELGMPWPTVTTSAGVAMQEQEINWQAAVESHWAWQPVRRPELPDLRASTETAAETSLHPIDAFVASRRERAGMASSRPAESHLLARRIYIDLWGILPTPQLVDKFVTAAHSDKAAAVKDVVDELLNSPMYGQRWGRHWLDVARYSDGLGGFLDNAALDDAWRYRDWVVDALSNDMPFNQFVEQQIVGDLSGDNAAAIATGFFALGPTYQSDGGDPDSIAQAKGETLDDRVDTLTRGLLGITGSCARCHDHKFDPIPQKDYYSLAGIFNNTAVHSLPLSPKDVVEAFNDHTAKVRELGKQIKQLKDTDEATATARAQLETQLADLNKNAPAPYLTAHSLREAGDQNMKVALRGNLRKEGEIAPRRFLRILAGAEPNEFKIGSGRKELAAAIVDPQNPLTARVFVNRVWAHHFGQGLVRTPSNFGTLGEKPTHPQLLDWLASEFVANNWSTKDLHRLIMTSETYQLSNDFNEGCFNTDGDNRLLWRMSPRRMDVEAWRDSLLFATGELDTTPNGPPIDDITTSNRRTMYAKVSRNGDQFASDVFLRQFDFPLMRATVAQRPSSVVPQQFLFLMNSPFMLDRARALAQKLNVADHSVQECIQHAYRLLYGRLPTDSEVEIGSNFLADTSLDGTDVSLWVQYAQILLSSNEFMFVR